jgi:hypothetical protein
MNPSSLLERWQLAQAINADPELNGSAIKVAVALMGFVNSRTGECFPSLTKIVAACGLKRSTVVLATQALESRGWVRIERYGTGDRDSNRYHFRFDRLRDGGCAANASPAEVCESEVGSPKIGPSPDVDGPKSGPEVVRFSAGDSPKIGPELEEDNSLKRTQDSPSLFGEGGLPEIPSFDFEAFFEQQFWPQYPLKVEKAGAKKLIKATIEGRRSDGLKATPEELLAGMMRYAAATTGKDPKYIKHPTTWLNKGCWTDEHPERASPGADAVWATIDAMARRNRRAG